MKLELYVQPWSCEGIFVRVISGESYWINYARAGFYYSSLDQALCACGTGLRQ
jgi:hypothetical protein